MIHRFLLAQRAPAEAYPPVLNQAHILSAFGEVTILDSASSAAGWKTLTAPDIRRVRVEAAGRPGSAPSRAGKMRAAWAFRRAFEAELKKNPSVVIAFEPEAASLSLRRVPPNASSPLRIVHLHEHPTPDAYAGSTLGRMALRRTLAHLDKADVVVVADNHRAAELTRLAGLDRAPLVVMNCPLLVRNVPDSRIVPRVRAAGLSGPIVQYHGAVGPDHGLEITIRSMTSWPSDACFVVVGAGNPQYVDSLRELASSLEVADRLVLLGRVPYDEVFAFAAGATVGVSILDTSKPNWRYAAGASNKRFEYMALGIPQVTSGGPGTRELFEQTGVALLAEDDPSDVSRQINSYLASPELREKASAAGRKMHMDICNYERQYETVLERIADRIGPLATGDSG